MKRGILICLFVTLTMLTCQVFATAIFVENFSFEEPGTGKIQTDWSRVPGWDSDGTPVDSGVEEYGVATDGTWTAFLMGGDPSIYNLTEHVITEGDGFELLFDACTTWSDSGITYLTASLYYDDGGTRVTVAEQEFELNWDPMVEYSITFAADTVPESYGHQIGIEFINSADGYTGIDNVRLNIDYAGIVYPPDGAENIPIDADLEWTLKKGFHCDVYFSTDANLPAESQVIFNEAATTYDPGILAFETNYYWKVNPIDPNVGDPIVYEGEVWSFTSMADAVTILSQPQSQTIPLTETASFTVGAISPREISYSWRKVGEDEYELGDTDTFTRENIQLGDEGYYYCILDDVETTATTEPARLMTERLVGWWKLNGDLTDSVEEEVPGAPTHDGVAVDPNNIAVDPNYAGGIDESGLEFFGDDRLVVIPDTGDYFNFHPQGMTVSLWLNSETTGWDGVVSKHIRDDVNGWVGWVIDLNGADSEWGELGATHFTLRGSHNDLFGNDDDRAMNDGEWYHFTAVMDATTNTTRVYVNGVQKNESGQYNFGRIVMNDEPLVFGAEDQYGRVQYRGMLDDVRIWNYPLSTVDIATLYTDFNPGVSVCVDQDAPWMHFDVVGEPGEPSYCRIDLEDFAELAAVWAECNLVPDCLP